jgi:mRNA-degrading endonuclease toxin of MazEF toxin-antitoxin module
VTVIRPALCTERITRLDPVRMREVCDALATASGC